MEKKTECEIVQDLLLGYVDGVLNTESKKLVEKHLEQCEKCSKKLNEIKSDIEENENNQKKEIDYLKKIRRKSIIESILLAIGIILIILIIFYLYKFIIINNILNNAKQTLKTNNFYRETRQIMSENEVSITKDYYKDGKYKSVWEIYSDNGKEVKEIKYSNVDSDEIIYVSEINKTVTIQKDELIKALNEESNIKKGPFSESSDTKINLMLTLGKAFLFSISTDTYDIGREYYVLRNQFENNQRWEIWIDKETGLPLKEVNREASKQFFEGTDIVKKITDIEQEYKYQFDVVTDEDVAVPDFTGYEVKHQGLLEMK